ncbi:MAG: 3'-5' exonuclease [Bacteroidales bacterium]|nr:3'-5' exonuclease [Bacteroidales bacterium]
MNDTIPLHKILFLDIETVPALPDFNALDETFQQLWIKKAAIISRDSNNTPEELYSRAGIYAEFGKIICISAGMINDRTLRIKSFASKNEKEILVSFSSMLTAHFNEENHYLCAHNGKEFDFPYICRRLLINGLPLPSVLQISGKKPWEIRHLDTMEMWKFGDYKNYTSLELLAAAFGIATPKDDIQGSEVYSVYWKDDDLDRIVIYCQKDVVTIAQLYLRYMGKAMILDKDIIVV